MLIHWPTPTHEDISTFRGMVDECLVLTRELGALSKEQVASADIRVTARKLRSFGGRKNRRPYASFHIGNAYRGGILGNSEDVTTKIAESIKLQKLATSRTAKQQQWAYRQNLLGCYTFIEYASFWDLPGIGPFASYDHRECWLVLIAHEIAHVINYNTTVSGLSGHGHGPIFQSIYRTLRATTLDRYRSGKSSKSDFNVDTKLAGSYI